MPSCFAACPGVKPASTRVCAAETVSRSEWRATGPAAAFSGRRNTVARALGDQPTLEVGDCSKDMEHQLASGRGRVDAFLEADQVDVVRLEVLDRFEQFLEGTPEAVEAGDTEAVAGAGMVDELGSARGARTVVRRSRRRRCERRRLGAAGPPGRRHPGPRSTREHSRGCLLCGPLEPSL